MIDTREKNPDLEQPPEWIEAREKVLRNVMEARGLGSLSCHKSQVATVLSHESAQGGV